MAKDESGRKVISNNRKASFNYQLEDRYDAGLVLISSEIKSIRANQVNITDGYVEARDGELWLMGVHIAPFEQASIFGHADPTRPRKLLLHKREIAKVVERLRERGYTAVPTRLYLERGRAKIEIALGRGKKQYDKRDDISKREATRQIQRALKDDY